MDRKWSGEKEKKLIYYSKYKYKPLNVVQMSLPAKFQSQTLIVETIASLGVGVSADLCVYLWADLFV